MGQADDGREQSRWGDIDLRHASGTGCFRWGLQLQELQIPTHLLGCTVERGGSIVTFAK